MRFASLALGLGLALSLFACVRSPLEMALAECGAGENLCGSACVPAGTCGLGSGGSTGGLIASVSAVGGHTGSVSTPSSAASAGSNSASSAAPSGGSPSPGDTALPLDCTDVAEVKASMKSQYDGRMVSVTGKDKQYYVQTNWWNTFDRQTVAIDGLSYTIGNPAQSESGSNNPMGYPSFFIGSYAGHSPRGSNLPKAVTALTEVPTVMMTNAKSKGFSDYNAAYDVWFTATEAPLPSYQYSPGPGGAFLMVWLFKPTDRQPRGRLEPGNDNHKVPGLPGTWDVWTDPSDPPCISYVSTTPLEGLAFDLNTVIKDSVSNGYGITDDMFLSVIFGGFEVWGGNDGLQLKQFCANVK